MPFIDWNDKLSVGNPQIDAHCRQLLGMVNELHDAVEEGRGHAIVDKALDNLLRHITTHFKYEEGLLLQSPDAAYAPHKQEHDLLTQQVLGILSQYRREERTGTALSTELLELLKVWLLHH